MPPGKPPELKYCFKWLSSLNQQISERAAVKFFQFGRQQKSLVGLQRQNAKLRKETETSGLKFPSGDEYFCKQEKLFSMRARAEVRRLNDVENLDRNSWHNKRRGVELIFSGILLPLKAIICSTFYDLIVFLRL